MSSEHDIWYEEKLAEQKAAANALQEHSRDEVAQNDTRQNDTRQDQIRNHRDPSEKDGNDYSTLAIENGRLVIEMHVHTSALTKMKPDQFVRFFKEAGFKFDSLVCPIKFARPFEQVEDARGWVLFRQWEE